MTDATQSPLGKAVDYARGYDPALLFPIARAANRARLGLDARLPFHGLDIWNAYELSWLDARGKPVVALGEFRVPSSSPNLIESKSLKLYLNSLNQERLGDFAAVAAQLSSDLSAAAGAEVAVALRHPADVTAAAASAWHGESIDDQDLDFDDYGPPDPAYLRADGADQDDGEWLVSDLLKSNCPVTGQPDWASVQIVYRGPRIERAGLLRYLVSFRAEAEFHEHCVERIFVDLLARCAPRSLAVYARYTRRGGLDINPFRCTAAGLTPPNPRLARQ